MNKKFTISFEYYDDHFMPYNLFGMAYICGRRKINLNLRTFI